MTRNNFSDQLSWLLADIDLTKPHAPLLPPARESASTASSPSNETVFFTPTAGLSPETAPNKPSTAGLYPALPNQPSHPSTSANVASVSGALQPQEQAVAKNMGRLVSKPGTRRPNLLILQEQLLSPASTIATTRTTTNGASLSNDYSAFLAKNSAKKRTTTQNAPSGSRPRNVFPTPVPTIPSGQPVDNVDLTNPSGSGSVGGRTISNSTAFGSDTCLWREDFASRPAPISPSEPSVAFGSDKMLWREDYASRPGPSPTDDDSVAFGSDVMVWEEEAAWRPEPLPAKRGKKRKSDQISQPPPTTTDDFPDIMDLLTDDELLDSLVKRSPTKSPARAKLKTSPSKTSPSKILPSITAVMETPSRHRANLACDRPSVKPHRIQLSQPSPAKSPKKEFEFTLDELESSETNSTSLHADSAPDLNSDEDCVVKPEAKRRHVKHDERVIQDSDDEPTTPPMVKEPRTPIPRTSSPIKRMGGSQREHYMHVPETPLGKRPPISSQGTTGIPSARKPDLHKQVLNTHAEIPDESDVDGITDAGPRSHQDTRHNDETLSAMLQLFLRQPSIIEMKRISLEERLRQNKESFKKSLLEGTFEPRDRLRRDKELLMKQQSSLDTLASEYRSYEDVVAKKDALIARISEAYEHDLNTEDDEVHLQELDGLLKSRQESLKQYLLNADIKDPTEYDQKTRGLYTHQPESIVQATQTTTSVPLSREPGQIPGAGAENAQIIMQTQVSARLDTHPPLIHSYPSESHGSRGRVHQFASLSPQRPARSGQHSAKGPELSTSAPHPGIDAMDYEGEDLFDAHDILPSRNLPKTTRVTRGRKSPKNEKVHQREGYESDYSDGIDISEFAQQIETGQSSSETARPSKSTRTALSETSGNLGLRKGKAVVKKKPSTLSALISPEQKNFPWYKDVRRALKDRFRMSGFRHNQLAAINATLAGKDAFILMPTGGGKSLCYQLPAVVTSGKTNGITVVVSPLLSLMHDQVEHLKALNIAAKAFNGDTPPAEKRGIMTALKERYPEHHFQLLYVTPEMINKSTAFLDGLTSLYRNNKLARLVIDEAHCVSQWGHDFRPDYKQLGNFRERFPRVPLMALTATATQNVIMDVKHNLGIGECEQFTQSFNRPNLYYEIRRKEKDNTTTIADLINSKYTGKTGIVYTLSRRSAETIAQKLRDQGIASHHYHASVDAKEKVRIQREWQQGKIKVVVATIAFGMGIDKPDVRFVIHQSVPKSLEGYYQETGRAGRDGEASECYLYFSYGDVTQLRKLIADGDGNEAQKERQRNMLGTVIAFCDNQSDCRRVEILRYFGETFTKAQCNATCDNCKSKDKFEQKNFTEYALGVLQIVRSEGRITLAQCTDYLMGKKKKADLDHVVWEFHSMAKALPKHEVHRVIDRLLAEEALREENVFRSSMRMAVQYYRIGRTANAFLAHGRQLWLTTRVKSGGSLIDASKGSKRANTPAAPAARKEQFPSTLVSSPARKSAAKKKGKAIANYDDEDSDEDFGTHRNGYAQDGFVVGDDDDLDNDFETMPTATTRSRKANPSGLPISRDSRLSEQSLTDIQRDILESFFEDATRLEERVRASSGRRAPLFTQIQIREMGLRWTISLEQMRQIPGIDAGAVDRHGNKILPLIQRYHQQYQEIMGVTPAPRSTPYLGEIVDLVSTDEEEEDEDEPEEEAELETEPIDDDSDDDDGYEEVGKTSAYFQSFMAGKTPSREDAGRAYQPYQQQPVASSSKSRGRSTGDGPATRGKGGWRGGKKQYASRRSSGGKFAGVRKKGTAAKKTTTGHSSRNSVASWASSSTGKGKGRGAQGVGFDGIGLMDH
ncbi:hypothetical protein GGR50DRAFT_649423 [Xylaria sp. CBS 124048]|nr:hypothetical protein GGR50DRAFT_649423 [Xylaria sp. CBS 124048]